MQLLNDILFNSGVPAAQVAAMAEETKAKAETLARQNNRLRFQKLIQASEGTSKRPNPYAVGFGFTEITDFTRHPGTMKTFTQTDGKKNKTSAAGAYQFLGSTYSEMAARTGKKDFSPESQDANFWELMKVRGVEKLIENGDFTNAVQKLGATFASLPSSKAKQPKHTWEALAKMGAEVGLTGIKTPTYYGEGPAKAKKPNVDLDTLFTAALPTAEESFIAAREKEARVQDELFNQQQAVQQTEFQKMADQRTSEIDNMLSSSFGFDDIFKPSKSSPTKYDAQIRKLVDQV